MQDETTPQDSAAMPPASSGSVWDDCDKHVLFSERVRMAGLAVKWCDEREAPAIPVNIVTALASMGMLFGSRPTLTDAEREAVVQSADFADWDAEYFAADRNKSLADGAAQRAATLRGLLERRGCCPDREQPARKGHATPARSGETGDDSPERE